MYQHAYVQSSSTISISLRRIGQLAIGHDTSQFLNGCPFQWTVACGIPAEKMQFSIGTVARDKKNQGARVWLEACDRAFNRNPLSVYSAALLGRVPRSRFSTSDHERAAEDERLLVVLVLVLRIVLVLSTTGWLLRICSRRRPRRPPCRRPPCRRPSPCPSRLFLW